MPYAVLTLDIMTSIPRHSRVARPLFLVDPALLSALPAQNLLLGEPEVDLLLGGVDTVAAVADVTADVLSVPLLATWLRMVEMRFCVDWTYDGVVTTDGARGAVLGVSGTKDLTADLASLTALPDHGADGAGAHVWGNQAVSVQFYLQYPNAVAPNIFVLQEYGGSAAYR